MFVVYLKVPGLGRQLVNATSYRIEGEHLVFCRDDGMLAALFLLEVVESWSSIDIEIA